MNPRQFTLLKDLPGCAAGTIFTQDRDFYWPTPNNLYSYADQKTLGEKQLELITSVLQTEVETGVATAGMDIVSPVAVDLTPETVELSVADIPDHYHYHKDLVENAPDWFAEVL